MDYDLLDDNILEKDINYKYYLPNKFNSYFDINTFYISMEINSY